MASEKTLNTPLSGAEVVKAIQDKIQEKLSQDCFFNPNHAYDWFKAVIQLRVEFHDAGVTINGENVVVAEAGQEPQPGGGAEEFNESVEIDAKSPNEVRVETGQEVPVLRRDANGKSVVEGIKYGRKALLKT